MPDGQGYQFGDYDQKPQEPQSPQYTSFARGVLGGFLGDVQQRQYKQANDEREARSNALRWIQSIPMSPHNAPILTKMSLDILASKPGKKHWTDQIFGTGKASTQYIDDLWGKLKGILPAGEGETAAEPATAPGEETTTYRSPQFGEWANPPLSLISAARQSTTSATAGAAPPLTDFTAAPATRPRTATVNMFDQTGGARDRTVTQPTIDTGSMGPAAPTLPARPTLNPSQISFADLPGRWQRDPTVFYDQEGNAFTYQYDQAGIQKPKRMDLGPVSTEKQHIAEITANARIAGHQEATFKAQHGLAANLAQMNPDVFVHLPEETKAPFYTMAGQILSGQALDKRALDFARTNLAKANLPVAEAKAKMFTAIAAAGGITPGQQLTNYQVNLGASRKYKEEHDELSMQAEAARKELNDLQNPTTPLGKSLKAAGAPDYMNKIRAAQMKYDEAAGKAKIKRDQAASMFPGLLRGTATGIEQLPSSPQTMQTMGTPESQALQDYRGRMTQSPTGDLPQTREAVEQEVKERGQNLIDAIKQFNPTAPGKTVAPPAPTPPPGGFKGTPPSITMQTQPRVILGTAANPATGKRPGSTMTDKSGATVVITKVNPPGPGQPYGSVEVSVVPPAKGQR